MPGHIGHIGQDKVDALAKETAGNPNIKLSSKCTSLKKPIPTSLAALKMTQQKTTKKAQQEILRNERQWDRCKECRSRGPKQKIPEIHGDTQKSPVKNRLCHTERLFIQN